MEFKQEENSWKVSNWIPFEQEDLVFYNNICDKLNLSNNTYGNVWSIPLNNEFNNLLRDNQIK